MAINADNAQAYFSEHVEGAAWQAFAEAHQSAGIAHAKRELSRMLGREISETEAAYAAGDQTRDEYAVYEQALYLLRNSSMPNTEASAPVFAAEDPDTNGKGVQAPLQGLGIAPGACRWLGVRTTYSIIRG